MQAVFYIIPNLKGAVSGYFRARYGHTQRKLGSNQANLKTIELVSDELVIVEL